MKVLVPSKAMVEKEVALPYYYKHDLCLDESDNVIYGKIEADKTTTVQLSWHAFSGANTVEVEVEAGSPERHACYFDEQYASTEAEYLEAVTKAKAFVEKL